MNDKLQELTQKIYNEGLEKGKKEADEIVKKAGKDAEKIVEDAKKEADQIKADAQKEADELKKNVNSELAISARQSITAIKQQITELISKEAVDEALKDVFDDKAFIRDVITKMIKNWPEIEKSDKDVILYLPESDRKKLEEDLQAKAAKKIKGGLDIEFEEGIKSGFKIGPKDGSYKISFTEKDFERFFRQYLRPRTQKLFAEEQQEQDR